MIYKELPCIYHPDLGITNFCQDQNCLMPLCPSCIREHTEYHQQIKSKPSYFNIHEALSETEILIANGICGLEKDKKRNSDLIYKIKRLPTNVHEKIQQAKTMAMKIIQQSFIELEKDTLQAISKLNEQINLHSIRKSQQLEQSIMTNLQDLYDLAEGLKTESCLSDMIFFLKQKRFQVEDLHTELSKYLYVMLSLLQSNQNYDPYIEVSKEAQKSLAVVIHRMLKLDSKEQQSQQTGRKIFIKDQKIGYDSYHLSLTPSKIKKPLNSFQREKPVNSFGLSSQNSQPVSSKPKNKSYQYNFLNKETLISTIITLQNHGRLQDKKVTVLEYLRKVHFGEQTQNKKTRNIFIKIRMQMQNVEIVSSRFSEAIFLRTQKSINFEHA